MPTYNVPTYNDSPSRSPVYARDWKLFDPGTSNQAVCLWKEQEEAMSQSNNPFRRPPSKPQDSVPSEANTRRARLDRQESLVRSNAVHRKPENPSSSKDTGGQPDFYFLPEHWQDTVLQPGNTSPNLGLHTYAERARARSRGRENKTPTSSSSTPPVKKATRSPGTCSANLLSPEANSLRESAAKTIEDLSAAADDLRSELQDYKRLVSSLGPALHSRRGILLLKAMQYQQQENPSPASQHGNEIAGLDDILSISEAATIAQALDAHARLLNPDSTCIRICALCNLPRFVRALSTQPIPPTGKHSEFSSEYSLTTCCRQNICDHCFLPAILSSLTQDWWFDLTYQSWIKCPIPACRSPLPLFYREQVSFVLRQLGDKDYTLHADQYQACSRLRSALVRHTPRPTEDALLLASALHRQLNQHGRIHNLLSSSSTTGLAILLMPIDSPDNSHTLQVPIFIDQFIRAPPRECIICTDSLPDVVSPTPQDEALWTAATSNFPGRWTSQIRIFPSPSSLPTCTTSHPLNICRVCLDRHISTLLDSRGVLSARDSLLCPSPGCSHSYTHEEIRLLVSEQTFVRCDKLKLLSNLSTQPDFRWCLQPNCGFGQIYQIADERGDGPGDKRRNRVECEECGFEMCFVHQGPWHTGLSCREYDKMRAADGGNEQATREWLRVNAKVCRCGAYVEKQGGCFHMKCRACGFEFCWECMADWGGIQGVDGRYEKRGHGDGCWFRGEGAMLPTQMRGDSIADALGRMGHGG